MATPMRTNRAYKVDSPAELVVILARIIRWAVRMAFRYRTECMLIAATLALYFTVDALTTRDVAGAVLMVALVATLAPPKPRAVVLGRLRCSRTRRALKAMSREERIDNTLGRPPLVYLSRSTHAGEAYRLYLRAGQSAEMLEGRREGIRAALHCRDVRVLRNPDRSHLVTIQVIRRDALSGVTVTSPLVELANAQH